MVKSLVLISDSPEGTQLKVREGQAKTNSDSDPSQASLSRLIFLVFAHQGKAADARQNQENKPGNLQPELVQYPSKNTACSAPGAHDRAERPAAAGVLGRYPCGNADLPGGGDAHHPTILSMFLNNVRGTIAHAK